MKDLVIGDIHFGIKTNSKSWLEFQTRFFTEQIIPQIQKNDYDRVVFLGDIFDSRYSVNEEVGCTIKNLFRKMLDSNKDKQFYFVAGNHDYYCPMIEFDNINAYELVFGEEFMYCHPNAHFITTDYLYQDETLFLPWYWTEDDSRWQTVTHDVKDAKLIYCHSNLCEWDIGKIASKNKAIVLSGHIHYPWQNPDSLLWNLGASCALNFNDVNTSRYIYEVVDGVVIDKIENITTPKFRRFYNEEIFALSAEDFENSFVQLCINNSNVNKARYIEQVKYLKNEYVGCNIKVNVIDESVLTTNNELIDLNTDITAYIEEHIPDHLTPKYQQIKEKLSNEIE